VERPAGGLKAGDRILPIDGQKQHDFTKITLNVALGTVPPRYSLSAEARTAIVAFLDAVKASPLVSAAPAHEFTRTLQKLNCGACHETDHSKPQSEDVEKLPPLTAVGAKLKKDWINQVLHDKRARVRFWLKTRMPEFGGAIDHVAEQAVAAAVTQEGVDPAREARAAAERRVKHLRDLPPATKRRRLMAYLVRRGFGGSETRDLVRELCGS